MLGRLLFIFLILLGAFAATPFTSRTGYHVWQSDGPEGVTCTYWIGFGLAHQTHGLESSAEGFECPLLVRDLKL